MKNLRFAPKILNFFTFQSKVKFKGKREHQFIEIYRENFTMSALQKGLWTAAIR